MTKERSSKDIIEDILQNIREYNVKWITPSDINNLGNLKVPEEVSKIKRILNILVFMKVLKFNKQYLLWENLYYKEDEGCNE